MSLVYYRDQSYHMHVGHKRILFECMELFEHTHFILIWAPCCRPILDNCSFDIVLSLPSPSMTISPSGSFSTMEQWNNGFIINEHERYNNKV